MGRPGFHTKILETAECVERFVWVTYGQMGKCLHDRER